MAALVLVVATLGVVLVGAGVVLVGLLGFVVAGAGVWCVVRSVPWCDAWSVVPRDRLVVWRDPPLLCFDPPVLWFDLWCEA